MKKLLLILLCISSIAFSQTATRVQTKSVWTDTVRANTITDSLRFLTRARFYRTAKFDSTVQVNALSRLSGQYSALVPKLQADDTIVTKNRADSRYGQLGAENYWLAGNHYFGSLGNNAYLYFYDDDVTGTYIPISMGGGSFSFGGVGILAATWLGTNLTLSQIDGLIDTLARKYDPKDTLSTILTKMTALGRYQSKGTYLTPSDTTSLLVGKVELANGGLPANLGATQVASLVDKSYGAFSTQLNVGNGARNAPASNKTLQVTASTSQFYVFDFKCPSTADIFYGDTLGTIYGTSYLHGTVAFSGTARRVAVYLPGASSSDYYTLGLKTGTDATPVADDLPSYNAKTDSLIIFRAGTSGTSGLSVTYMRMR
jgi:hypothetical protein